MYTKRTKRRHTENMYLISVYFDVRTNKTLQRYIDRIASATGNGFMVENNVPPHMTISSIEANSVDVLLPAFESLEGRLTSGEIQLVSVGQLFPYVMYVMPVMNEYLLNLSRTVFDLYDALSAAHREIRISRYYRPLSWLPHITLAKTLDKAQMRKAFEVMQGCFVPFAAKVTEIGLAKVNPHEDVKRFVL